MTELLTAAQMRAIEQAAIASGEVTGLELMERAGRGVVEAVFEEWPDLAQTSHRAVVLCGPGNNGGDGFVVARLLKDWGWEVEVFLYGDPDKLPPDARVNYERWVGMGEVRPLIRDAISDQTPGKTWNDNKLWGYLFQHGLDIVVDAIFGTGLTRPAFGNHPMEMLVHSVFVDGLWWHGDKPKPWIVAIDNPSDMCCNSGREIEGEPRYEAYAAHLTVTFHRPKLGHYLDQAPRFCTKLVVAEIGLPGSEAEKYSSRHPLRHGTFLTRSPTEDGELFLGLARSRNGHKYTHGHALILSGGPGKGGAARLAARGALRIGAGLVTVGCPPEALAENAAQLTAVMLNPVHDADALGRILQDSRINALALGPGLGLDDRAEALVATALGLEADRIAPWGADRARSGAGAPEGEAAGDTTARSSAVPGLTRDLDGQGAAAEERGPGSGPGQRGEGRRAVVLDADALTILARRPDLFAALHDRCVLTPHAGEFARLFPDIAAKLAETPTTGPAYSKVDATREAAARAGCVVLYKGPDTVIADPKGRCAINSAQYDRAAPWLATAGSGDVLAGFIAGLLARRFAPIQAAETAAWLHVECALSFGPGLIAEDIPEELPRVFRDLGL